MGHNASYNPYSYVMGDPANYVDPTGEFPWLLAGLFLAGGGIIDLGFQMGIEGRSFDDVNWLRVGVAGGTTAIGGVFGKALHSASIGGRAAFAAGAVADFGVGVAADRYLIGDGWGTAVASNAIGFGVGEIAGYAGKGIAHLGRGLFDAGGRFAGNMGLAPVLPGGMFGDLNGGRILRMSSNQPELSGMPQPQYPSKVNYRPLDIYNRPTGVDATLERPIQDVPYGTSAIRHWSSANPNYNADYGLDRTHLLAHRLGGRNVAENIVPFSSLINQDQKRGLYYYEEMIEHAVRAGQTVNFSITPIYKGRDVIPVGIELRAVGSGDLPIDIWLSFANDPWREF